MDRFVAVTVAALALTAPVYCRHAPPLPLVSTEVSSSQPPLADVTLSMIPVQPEDWPTISRKPHIKHLYSDEGKLWTKFPNSKHLVEIVPLRHKTKLKKGKALAYILPKSKNRKQLGFGTIQDLNNIVFDSEEFSDDFGQLGSSESDSTSFESNGEYTMNPDIESIEASHKSTGFNSENIINSNLNDIVAFTKDNSDDGDLTYETVNDDRPEYHGHYIAHSKHRNKLNHDINIPSHGELQNVLKDKKGHHIKLKQILVVPGESPVPFAVPISIHGMNSDVLVPSSIHGHSDISIPGIIHKNSDLILPKISDLILGSNSHKGNNFIVPGNVHEVNSDFIVPAGISDLILPTDIHGMNSGIALPGNYHETSHIIPHAVPVSIQYSNEDPEVHHTDLKHPSHKVTDEFDPFDIVNNYHSTHSTQNPNDNHVKGKENTLGHIHSSISENTQVHDVTHDPDVELRDILDMLSDASLAEQHSYAPIKASDETSNLVDLDDQSESNDSSNSELSDSASIDSLPESKDVQLQFEPTDNSNLIENASDSSSYSDEVDADVASSIEGNADIDSILKPDITLDASGVTLGDSSSEESSEHVNGADITVASVEQHSVLPDCLRIKKKKKKDCNGHKYYQLTFMFNR